MKGISDKPAPYVQSFQSIPKEGINPHSDPSPYPYIFGRAANGAPSPTLKFFRYLAIIGERMDIYKRNGGNEQADDAEIYQCWMCGMVHRNPTAYLWHIHACGLERTGKSAIMAKQEITLSVAAIKKQ